MTTSTKTEFDVTVKATIYTMVTVTGKKSWDWKKAAKAGLVDAQEQLEITAKEYEIDVDFLKVTEDDVCGDDVVGDYDWEVTVKAEVITQIGVSATDWREAAKLALTLAQNNLEIVSDNDVAIDWQRITEDMVD